MVAVDGLIWCQGYMDYGAFEEVNVTAASKGADQMNAGVTMNMVIKSGSNNWDGSIPYIVNPGADGLFGTSDDPNLAGACSGGGTGVRRLDGGLDNQWTDEYTAGLEHPSSS
jgi:hypothetical protein